MKYLVLCIFAVALSEDPLRPVLRSPRASLKLYFNFKERNLLRFSLQEEKMRYKLFLKSAQNVADYNEDKIDTAHHVLNIFSVMTKEEKMMHVGLNASEVLENPIQNPSITIHKRVDTADIPTKLLWTNTGHVTKVKDQKSCGASWTFAAVGALETRYAMASGVLRSFSEQEFLDCTYEKKKRRDGCNGGWSHKAYYWSIRNGGRLAANEDRPYEKVDRECRAHVTKNAMKAAKIVAVNVVPASEEAHIEAMQQGALVSAMEVTDKFRSYDGGIIRDTTCFRIINHGVAMVGYTHTFIVIKNSWGTDWGEDGFARLARYHHNCHIYMATVIPRLELTGQRDSEPNEATKYRPKEGPCKDYETTAFCKLMINCCTIRTCAIPTMYDVTELRKIVRGMRQRCAKTCAYCE